MRVSIDVMAVDLAHMPLLKYPTRSSEIEFGLASDTRNEC